MKPSTSDRTALAGSSYVSPGIRRYLRSQDVPATGVLTVSQVVRFLLLHVPLMLVFRALPIAATLYSLLVVLIGLHFLVSDAKPTRVAWVVAYIAGAEILWRGAEAALVWEYGKYATLLLCILMILKYGLVRRMTLWPILFIAALLPGIFIVPEFDREAISYQLAGPFALAVATLAYSAIEFRRADMQRLLLAAIAPTVAMGFLVLVMLLTQDIAFYGGGENEAITGGIGANQVASALSLGSTAAFFSIFLAGKDRPLRYLMLLIALGLLGLSVLTFSRAGLWNTVGAAAAGTIFLAQERRRFLSFLNIALLLGSLVYFVSLPLLTDLTGGSVLVRFRSFDATGRDVLAEIDYEVFQSNPVLGVGVGRSVIYHVPYFGYPKPTHTEYTRLLAEHGSFGVAAIALLAAVTLSRFFSPQPPSFKAISAGFTVWTLLYLVHSATRMVAPSFAFGLAAARFLDEEESNG